MTTAKLTQHGGSDSDSSNDSPAPLLALLQASLPMEDDSPEGSDYGNDTSSKEDLEFAGRKQSHTVQQLFSLTKAQSLDNSTSKSSNASSQHSGKRWGSKILLRRANSKPPETTEISKEAIALEVGWGTESNGMSSHHKQRQSAASPFSSPTLLSDQELEGAAPKPGKGIKSGGWFGSIFSSAKSKAHQVPDDKASHLSPTPQHSLDGSPIMGGLPLTHVKERAASLPGAEAGNHTVTGEKHGNARPACSGSPGSSSKSLQEDSASAMLEDGVEGSQGSSGGGSPFGAAANGAAPGSKGSAEGEAPAGPQAGDGKKALHKRHRSLTQFLQQGLKLGRARGRWHSGGSLEEVTGDPDALLDFPAPGDGQRPSSRTGTPQSESSLSSKQTPSGGSPALSCFGLGVRSAKAEDAEEMVTPNAPPAPPRLSPDLELVEPPTLPLNAIGIRNIGNSCFLGAALQCLRHTPRLPLLLVPGIQQPPEGDTRSGPGEDGPGELSQQPHQQGCEHSAPVLDGSAGEWEEAQAAGPRQATPAVPPSPAPSHLPESRGVVDGRGGAMGEGDKAAQGATGGLQQQQQGGEDSLPAPLTAPSPACRETEQGGGQPVAGQAAAEEAAADQMGEPGAGGAGQLTPQGGFLSSGSSGAAEAPAGGSSPTAGAPGGAAEEGEGEGSAAEESAGPAAVPGAPAAKPSRPERGALKASFERVMKDLFHKDDGGSVDPCDLLGVLKRFPTAADYFDGGQHDCQEVLRVMMDLLHDELNRVPRPPPPLPEAKPDPDEAEEAKAERHWQQYLLRDSSPVTDLFSGQLQSSVRCHGCGRRFTMYEPFWDLSLPLAKEGKGKNSSLSWLGMKGTPASIQDCFRVFTADEVLEGEEAFHCEVCKGMTTATKHLRVHRFPDALVLQIKRFKYKGSNTDKLTANVSFPLKGLDLHQFASPESPCAPHDCTYDLFAVGNHYGSLSGGHYTATCRAQLEGGQEAWYSYSDEVVQKVEASTVVSQHAYMLFYTRRRYRSKKAN